MAKSILTTGKIVLSTIALCGLTLNLTSNKSFAEVDQGPKEMVLKTSKAKKPAIFPHADHQNTLQCSECHHGKNEDGTQKTYEVGDKMLKCESCHNKTDMSNKKLNTFKGAAHAKCKSCHTKLKKAGKSTGPTKCNGCHVKK